MKNTLGDLNNHTYLQSWKGGLNETKTSLQRVYKDLPQKER